MRTRIADKLCLRKDCNERIFPAMKPTLPSRGRVGNFLIRLLCSYLAAARSAPAAFNRRPELVLP